MCLSTAALATFLSIIADADMTRERDSITIHATERDAIWAAAGPDSWCTEAPARDRRARLSIAG